MKTLRFLIIVLSLSLVFPSCDDLLDTDIDNQYIEKDDNDLSNPNDSVFSLFGILAEMQKLGSQYVILGELRGDLVDVTNYSDKYLREINEFNISSKNPYIDVRPFYTVINNCNYVIENMDTLASKGALLPDYAAAVRVRAWTYLQLLKNYSYVRYSEKPIENVEDALNPDFYPIVSKDEIIDKLIDQLLKVHHVPGPLRYVDAIDMKYMIPTADFLLGELYLWQDKYTEAATYYKQVMEKGNYGYLCSDTYYPIEYYVSGGVRVSWGDIFSPTATNINNSNLVEVMAGMYYHATYGYENELPKLFVDDYKLKPSSASINYWYDQQTNIYINGNIYGDFRSYVSWKRGSQLSRAKDKTTTDAYINKFGYDSTNTAMGRLILERASLVHLRYAEAVNRLGKPTLALAALNYGVKKTVLENPLYVNQSEVAEKTYITNFDHTLYNTTAGVRGRVDLKPITIPSTVVTTKDSMLYVEDMILKEAALEMAYEGNRWGDLVRVALRRFDDADSPNIDYLANIVAEKFTNTGGLMSSTPSADAETIKAKLRNKENFFIPFPEE